MFSTVLSEITDNVDKKFLMNVFFPTLLFIGSLVFLAHINDTSNAIKIWSNQPIEIQTVEVIVFLFIVTFFSYLFDGYLTSILRLFEGYWEGRPILGRVLNSKKKQHQIILQISELQLTLIDEERTYLDMDEEYISLKHYIENNSHRYDFHTVGNYLDEAEKNLNTIVDNLHSANKILDESQKIVKGKTLKSWFFPNLNKAENIIAERKSNHIGTDKGVMDIFKDTMELKKQAMDSLDQAKKEIILLHCERSIGAAANAIRNMVGLEKEIDALMKELAKLEPKLNSLDDRLRSIKEQTRSLRMGMDEFTNEDKYIYAENAESDSKQVSSVLKFLETNLKAIGNDPIFNKPVSQTAKDHCCIVFEILESTKAEWRKLDISGILKEVHDSSKSTEDIKRNKYETEEAMSKARQIYEKIYFYYPPVSQPQEVMPTELGNVLKSAEMYPKEKYNVDAVFFWSKLYPLLSSEWTAALANARGSLDLMVLISFLSFSLSILGGLTLILSGAQPIQFILVFYVFFIIGWIAYKGAITYAVTYGDLIRSTFDLYRDKLITEMGLKRPESIQAEKVFWSELGQWLYRNMPPSAKIQYSNATSSEEAA